MEDYPPNSRKQKEAASRERPSQPEPRKIEKVIESEVIIRKKPLRKRFLETFVGGDDAKSVWVYIVQDVLVPAGKDMIADAVSQGLERMLFGEVRSSRSAARSGVRGSGIIDYRRISSPIALMRRDDPRQESMRRAQATHDFGEMVFATRVEAEEVRDSMFEVLNQYESVSVADLFEMVGRSSNFTDNKWGWTDLRGTNVIAIRGGRYLLDLPSTEQLD